MRILRRDDLDLEASPEDVFRDDHLREMVDRLPPAERHMISAYFFGQKTLAEASADLRVSRASGKKILQDGLARLRSGEASALEEGPYADVTAEELTVCTYVLDGVGRCQQHVKAEGLCSFHHFQSQTGIIPDAGWHEKLVRGGRNIYDSLTETEMNATVNGRYRGDGRRIDQFVTDDPLGWDPLEGRDR